MWRRVGEHHESEDQSQGKDTTVHQPSSSWSILSILRQFICLVRNPDPCDSPTHAATITTCSPVPNQPAHIGDNAVHEFSIRVARTLETCKNRNLFSDKDLWRKRTQACIETTASLIHHVDAKLSLFGDISKLLGDIGSSERIWELSLAGMDQLFAMRWTCLSLMVIRQILEGDVYLQSQANQAMCSFAKADDTGNDDVIAGAQRIDETLHKAKDCLLQLSSALPKTEELTEVKEILVGHESHISELEQINIEAKHLESVDHWISIAQFIVNDYCHQITSQIPGVSDDLDRETIPFSRLVELFCDIRKMQFIQPMQTLKSMCSPAMTLRNILEGQGDADAYKELLKNLKEFHSRSGDSGWQGDEMQRQLWRLHDVRDGGGLGFTLELFFLALSQLLSTSSSMESHSALYKSTFRAITSNWIGKHKDSDTRGTQVLLLNIAMPMAGRLDSVDRYPAYIVDEFLLLLGDVFEGQTGPHIDKAREKFKTVRMFDSMVFRERVLRILPNVGGQAQSAS